MVLFHSLWTLVLFLIFIDIVLWAWSARRKARFDDAARLPMEDDKYDPDKGMTNG